MTTKTTVKKAPARPSEMVSFYGGQVVIEKKPWGDHFRFFKVVGNEKISGILSATSITKHLDKSQVLLPWAVGLVGSHIRATIESSVGSSFSKEEIFLVVNEAVLKPEEAKTKGGTTGDFIHDFCHDFALSVINKTKTPSLPKMEGIEQEEKDKVMNGINAFLDWYNGRKVDFLQMETLVYYNSLIAGDTSAEEDVVEYLGIMDLLARVDGKVGVWDYKTGKRVYTDQRYQLSGYRKAHNSQLTPKEKLFAVESGVLSFSKETGELTVCKVSTEESEKDFKAFKGLHAVALRERELLEEYNQSKKDESK